MRISAEGTYHLLELAEKKKAKFFLASTSEVYGDPNVHPQPETYWGHVNPIGERSVYDEGKRYAEAIMAAYHRERGQPIRHIRIFNTYGPLMQAEDGRVVTNFIVRALRGESLMLYGDGSQTRSFQFVDDLVEGIVRLMGVDYSGPVNLGNPDEYTVRRVRRGDPRARARRRAARVRSAPKDDPRQRKPDITVAKKVLGWQPQVPLRTGILQDDRLLPQSDVTPSRYFNSSGRNTAEPMNFCGSDALHRALGVGRCHSLEHDAEKRSVGELRASDTVMGLSVVVASAISTRSPAATELLTSSTSCIICVSGTCVASATRMGTPRCIIPVRAKRTAMVNEKSRGAPLPAGTSARLFHSGHAASARIFANRSVAKGRAFARRAP